MIELSPWALLNLGETLSVVPAAACVQSVRRSTGGQVLDSRELGLHPLTWSPTEPGSCIVEFPSARELLTRYVGVAAPGWAVCQLTVGTLTAEDFDAIVHTALVPVDYYVALNQATDPRWREYEHRYGDAIHHLLP